MRTTSTSKRLPVVLLLAATAAAYQPALPGGFVLDDRTSIETNPRVRAPDSVRIPTPIEMLGFTPFPRIGKPPYFLTIGGYGFYWFELRRGDE